MRIQNNIPALNTLRQMGLNINNTSGALEKLSSGFRINRAGDDAAGLAISEKMRAQVRGLNRAADNALDGVSLVQSADGALAEVHSILHRMRELSVQAANDVNSLSDRVAIQAEISELIDEIDRVAHSAEFNGRTILDGSLNDGKYARLVSGSNVGFISLITPNDGYPLLTGMTSVAVVEAGAMFDMEFDFRPIYEPVRQDAFLHIEISQDVALSAGLNPEFPPVLTIPVFQGDTGAVIAGNVRSILSELLGQDWQVTSVGSRMSIRSNYAGRFGGCALHDGDIGAFNITASSHGAIDGDLAYEVFSPVEWVTGEPHTGVLRSDNVIGTIGRDMRIEVNGQAPEFGFPNFINWQSPWTNTEEIPAGISSELTGILRGRDTIRQLFLGSGAGQSQSEQFSFRVLDPTRTSGAIVATIDGNALTLQVGANSGHAQTVRFGIQSMSAVSLGVSELDVRNHAYAQMALDSIDRAIQIISDQRGALGAIQNRLDYTILNLENVSENLAEAKSRIRDADMAREMMEFTKHSILTQTSQAMMAQSNNMPQGVLQLLR